VFCYALAHLTQQVILAISVIFIKATTFIFKNTPLESSKAPFILDIIPLTCFVKVQIIYIWVQVNISHLGPSWVSYVKKKVDMSHSFNKLWVFRIP